MRNKRGKLSEHVARTSPEVMEYTPPAAAAAAAAARGGEGEDIPPTAIRRDGSIRSNRVWRVCGYEFSKECVMYMTRCIMLYMIAIASIVNLTLRVPPQEVWITALTVALGGMGFVMLGNAISNPRQKPEGSVSSHG